MEAKKYYNEIYSNMIIEYMGLPIDNPIFLPEKTEYHSDWAWLIPVINKMIGEMGNSHTNADKSTIIVSELGIDFTNVGESYEQIARHLLAEDTRIAFENRSQS